MDSDQGGLASLVIQGRDVVCLDLEIPSMNKDSPQHYLHFRKSCHLTLDVGVHYWPGDQHHACSMKRQGQPLNDQAPRKETLASIQDATPQLKDGWHEKSFSTPAGHFLWPPSNLTQKTTRPQQNDSFQLTISIEFSHPLHPPIAAAPTRTP